MIVKYIFSPHLSPKPTIETQFGADLFLECCNPWKAHSWAQPAPGVGLCRSLSGCTLHHTGAPLRPGWGRPPGMVGVTGGYRCSSREPSTVGTHFFSVMLQNEMEERAEEVPRGSCPGANAGMWVCASRLPPWVASSSTSKATPLFVMSESVAWVGTACLPQP